MPDCIFCTIARKEVPATVVYEDAEVMVFLDIMPARKGHLLVVPKVHYQTLLDIPPEKLATVMRIVQRCARGVQKALHADGFNIVQFNGRASGQIVDHFHVHIIPRVHNDGLRIDWEHEMYGPDEMKRFAEKITPACVDETE